MSQDLDALNRQNEELQRMKDNHTVEYTSQSYKLDLLGTAARYNWMLDIVYRCLAVVAISLTIWGGWSWTRKGVVIAAVIVVPYLTHWLVYSWEQPGEKTGT